MSAARKGLNILYVGTLPPHQGGSAVVASLLLKSFAALSHTARALSPITPEALDGGDSFALNHPAIGVTRFPLPYCSPDSPPPDHVRKLERGQIEKILPLLIARERPDIIIIGRESVAWEVPDIARMYSLPSILMVHGGRTFGSVMGGFSKGERQLLEQFRKPNLIITVAKHLADSLRQFGFNNIEVIPNPVDLNQFSPGAKDEALCRQLGISDSNAAVVHVSNLRILKRPFDLVSSAQRALKKNPKLVYVIVGDGPCRRMMEESCRQKHILENFKFVGWVDHDRVPDYLNLADIVVMLSEAEAQALVYLETQACGRLLLASDIPGAREVIANGETGLLFHKGDIDDLTAKTLLAAADPVLRAEIGCKAREQVQAHDLKQTVAAYLATLEDVILKHRAFPISSRLLRVRSDPHLL